MKSKATTAYTENCALDTLASSNDNEIQEFARRFLFTRSTRPKDPDAQYRILQEISKNVSISDSYRLFSIVAAAHKSIEMRDTTLMHESLIKLSEAKTIIQELGLSDELRSDRTHAHSSVLSIEAHLHFFLDQRNGLIQTLTSAHGIIRDTKVEELGQSFFLTCTNFGRLLGLCHVASGQLHLKQKDILQLLMSNFEVGIIKRVKAPKIKESLGSFKAKDYTAYWEFLSASRIYALADASVRAKSETRSRDLSLDLLRICIRHSRLLSEVELEAKLDSLF